MFAILSLPRRRLLRRLAGGGLVFATFFKGSGWSGAQAGKPPLILLDPGHGGHDPGTKGSKGTLEKDVTLLSAQALKDSLRTIGLSRVELTRTLDRFVPLEDRTAMALDINATLMISLHADALSDPSVRGASVYTLARHASNAEAEALARRENGPAAMQEGRFDGVSPEVANILTSLAGHEVRAASARLAHEVVRDLERDLPVLSDPERQANFTVLHTPNIPSVLIEMGFLSNPADEQALNDPAHTQMVARAIARAVGVWLPDVKAG